MSGGGGLRGAAPTVGTGDAGAATSRCSAENEPKGTLMARRDIVAATHAHTHGAIRGLEID